MKRFQEMLKFEFKYYSSLKIDYFFYQNQFYPLINKFYRKMNESKLFIMILNMIRMPN